ncbi:MAG: hypothetical protein J7494_00785 [Sphingobium sp.]|nr:hypothetical protein [Sphingobium sp.]
MESIAKFAGAMAVTAALASSAQAEQGARPARAIPHSGPSDGYPFVPATDENGKPIVSSKTITVVWRLPR